MTGRLIAIGDVHGCSVALEALLNLLQPKPSDTIVMLGDYVSRGPSSRGVLDQLIALQSRCALIPLLGNHDELLLANRSTRTSMSGLVSKDPETSLELFDDRHFDFLDTCVLYHETDTHFFVHANYDPKLPLHDQKRYTLLWVHLQDHMPKRHRSRKIAVVGHSSQRSGEILDLPHLKCLDTWCYGGGWLTAMDVYRQQLLQVSREGKAHGRQVKFFEVESATRFTATPSRSTSSETSRRWQSIRSVDPQNRILMCPGLICERWCRAPSLSWLARSMNRAAGVRGS